MQTPDAESGDPREAGSETSPVPERVVLTAQIGLDRRSYLALEQALIDLLENDTHILTVRLLAMNALVSAAVTEYGRGSKATADFSTWIEHMGDGFGQNWIYHEAGSAGVPSARRRLRALAPIISVIEAGAGRVHGHQPSTRRLPTALALARGKGVFYFPSLETEVDLEAVGAVGMDHDLPALRSVLVNHLGAWLRGKSLLRYPSIFAGARGLLFHFALVEWYATALASTQSRQKVEAEDMTQAIEVVERCYQDNKGNRISFGRQPVGWALSKLAGVTLSPLDLVAEPAGAHRGRTG